MKIEKKRKRKIENFKMEGVKVTKWQCWSESGLVSLAVSPSPQYQSPSPNLSPSGQSPSPSGVSPSPLDQSPESESIGPESESNKSQSESRLESGLSLDS